MANLYMHRITTSILEKIRDSVKLIFKKHTANAANSNANNLLFGIQEHYKSFGNIMIDVETLSTRTNASIIEIAAVEFNKYTGAVGDIFDRLVEPSEWVKNDRNVDGTVILWWMCHPDVMTKKFLDVTIKKSNLKSALYDLSTFVKEHDNINNDGRERVTVWGNGVTMDITVLQSAYEHFNMKVPWQFWAVNDCRTISSIIPDIKENTEFEGVRHNPVDDCKHQIKYVSIVLKKINEALKQ